MDMAFNGLWFASAFFLGAGLWDHFRASSSNLSNAVESLLAGLATLGIVAVLDAGRYLHASPSKTQFLFQSPEFVLVFGALGIGGYMLAIENDRRPVRALGLAGAFFGGYLVLSVLFGALLA